MNKKLCTYILAVMAGFLLFPIHVEAVSKTPEYEFIIEREHEYADAKDPSGYTLIEDWSEFMEKYPEYCDGLNGEYGYTPGSTMIFYGDLFFKFDSITINGKTCTFEPMNNNDYLGQLEALSKVYFTAIGEERYYTGYNVKREDLHRFVLYGYSPELIFEDVITSDELTGYLGGCFDIKAGDSEVYINFDDEKVRLMISSYKTKTISENPFSEMGSIMTGGIYDINPKLEVNGREIDYIGVLDREVAPEGLVWTKKYKLRAVHEDGTICEALKINPYLIVREEDADDIDVCSHFEIQLEDCENCPNEYKIAGVDIKSVSYEEFSDKTTDVKGLSFYKDENGNIKSASYHNYLLTPFYFYKTQNAKDGLSEFIKHDFDYTVIK